MPSRDTEASNGPPPGRSSIVGMATGGMVAGILAICAIVVSLLLTARDTDMRRASLDAKNIAAGVSAEIARTFELYGLSLQGAVEGAINPEVMALPPGIRQMVLFDRASTASDLGKILVLDEKGDPIADSTTLTPQRINYADRDYFLAQRETGRGLYVSDPLVSRSTGDRMVALSRRIEKPDGSFGGVVVGTVHLDYFRKVFAQVELPQGATVALVHDDGAMLMRYPRRPETSVKVKASKLLTLASTSAEGDYQGRSPIDGVERLYHFVRISDLPIVLDVGLSTAEILAQWRSRNLGIVVALGFCCTMIGLLTLWLAGEVSKRAAAERALTLAVETDALTGIANRRCLDKTLQSEWSRARRQRLPLSILMIDADHFKTYNDLFGHAEGDEALKVLAGCLAASAKRTGDLAARYGGEEFTLVLPNTDSAGAQAVAEKLRAKLAESGLAHPGSPLGRFTISIGIATMVPRLDGEPADLVTAADAALYVSKRDGRDRATVAQAAKVQRDGDRVAA